MQLTDLRNIYCCVCKKRVDKMGDKPNIVQIKTIDLLIEIKDFYTLDNNFENLNEIVRGKHAKKMQEHMLF